MTQEHSDQEVTGRSLSRRDLRALVEASEAINRRLQPEEVFRQIATHAAAVLRAEAASVLVYDEDRRELVFAAAVGQEGEADPAGLEGTRFDAELGFAGRTLREGRALRIDSPRREPSFFEGIDAKTGMTTRNLLATPLCVEGSAVGVVEVLNARDEAGFTEADLELARVFGNLSAAAVRNARRYQGLAMENRARRQQEPRSRIVGEGSAVRELIRLCRRVAPSQATVLIQGETGTGKEQTARFIHAESKRAEKPFVVINCAALPESLLESELFGHEAGAFTGATHRKPGQFELAHGGTLFLDEIGEMPAQLQAKLLRLLENQTFRRVGGTQDVVCDVRILAATNRDLQTEVREGHFREDLYYRLNIFPVYVPPLRERVEDIPPLVEAFADQIAGEMGVGVPTVTGPTMEAMKGYGWPGNIRQLRNVLERCILLADGPVTPDLLPPEITRAPAAAPAGPGVAGDGGGEPDDDGPTGPGEAKAEPGRSRLEQQERAMILEALRENGWNRSAAARSLGISRDNLRYRIRKYGLDEGRGGS